MTEINDQPKTREELYERIRLSSKDDFIHKDMIRLGFWDKDVPKPIDPPEEIKKRKELEEELAKLKKEIRIYQDEKALLKRIRKERFEASTKKKQENKLKREEEKKLKAESWSEAQNNQIIYLGEDVSKGLNYLDEDIKRLNKYNLPSFKSTIDLAHAMGVDINKLRFLAYSRKVSTYSHYIRFQLVKKSGGFRNISAPTKDLKEAQYWILNNILNKVTINSHVHGFTKDKSITTNAQNHINPDAVINIDLENFFPTINYRRVKGMFLNLGYSENISIILALITTEPVIQEITLDNKKYFVAQSERFLPQGAPTSPAITNIICRKFDKRISHMAAKLGFIYTRYADDLTFSAKSEELKNIGKILKYSENIITEEGFKINSNKTKVLRKNTRQEVTGIVINQKMNVNRKTLKNFRATLFQIENEGLEGKNWNNSKDLISSITGYANFIYSVNPEKGKEFLEQIKRIKKKYPQPIKTVMKKVVLEKPEEVKPIETENNESEKPKKKWWKLF